MSQFAFFIPNFGGGGGGGGGVSSLNTLTGALTLAAGSNITITPSGGNTLTIASSGGALVPGTTPITGGTSYKALVVDAASKFDQSSVFFDNSGVNSIDFWNRFLWDVSSGNVSVAWDLRLLTDNTGQSSLDWNGRTLTDTSNVNNSLDWSNRYLNDQNSFPVLGWNGTQQIGFFGTSTMPVSQANASISPAFYNPGGGSPVSDGDTFNGYSIGQIVSALQSYGLLA